MKLNNFLNTYKLLQEGAIASDFTWGFELEAYCTRDMGEGFSLPSYHSKTEPAGTAKQLKDELDDLFNKANEQSIKSLYKPKNDEDIKKVYGRIGSDGSLKNPSKGGWSFEYSSGVFNFSVKGAIEVLKILYNELPKLGIYTNDTCGFHTHASMPYLTKEDAVWMICCISIDEKIKQELTELSKDGIVIPFWNDYAKKEFYEKIKKNILEKNWREVEIIVSGKDDPKDSNGKYRNVRIHSDVGTLEWRGPRNFLNDYNYELIKEYIKKVYRVLMYYSKIISEKSWKSDEITITREMIDKNVSLRTSFNTQAEERKDRLKIGLIEQIKKKPEMILALRPQQIIDCILYSSYAIIDTQKAEILHKLLNKFNKKTINDIFNKITYADGRSWIEILDQQNYEFTLDTDIINKYMDANTFFLRILPHSEEFNEKAVLKFPERNWDDKREIIKYIGNNISNVPMDFWKKILKPGYFSMIMHIELPEKIQKMLIKKNPYNIQYIKNPSESAKKMASKEVEDIDQYIPRI